MKPKTRVKLGKTLLHGSYLAGIINVILYRPLHIINEADLILVTLMLSWAAISLTAADFLNTSDVRTKQ